MSKNEQKTWPDICPWPEPYWGGEGPIWSAEFWDLEELDEEGEELREIREYMDELVEEGRLNPDYSLNEEYDAEDSELDEEEFIPEKGADYWGDGFDLEAWEYDMADHINLLKLDVCDPEDDPVIFVRGVIEYDFINENLLRQAFTRRSFAAQYHLAGACEELEFYGDSILNIIVTREMWQKFSCITTETTDAPFCSAINEGKLTKLRSRFISREHLAERAAYLGLDRFILLGDDEKLTDAAREDMMEALLGAVAVDSGWNRHVLEDVADRLINIQLDDSTVLLRESAYERMNTWHQKRFGSVPSYELHHLLSGGERYLCTLRYLIPENDKGLWTSQRVDVEERTRSGARELAAETAISFVKNNGLWMNLKDAGIEPQMEDAINQLQELWQKKYIEKPQYSIEAQASGWRCECRVGDFEGFGCAVGKVKAKKKAAFMVLVRLLCSAGIENGEWDKQIGN